jgi:glyoxylase-like metal-dependent hydrolase (beta-lactamase superfamily II)/rhodanese-related sulfurtransferase
MLLKQYYLGCLAHASYLIGDEVAGIAAVVDPQRDVDEYLADAAAIGARIEYVFLTHFHADFVAGHLELRERAGATICLGRRAEAEYPFRAFEDGESLDLGSTRLEVAETPGHSPESISLIVYDLTAGESPKAVLTGDTLFVGDVGRPDLRASMGWSAEDLGSLLYDSLHNEIMRLPDETLVYPAHGAGSMCGKSIGDETVSTIGVQRRFNYALQSMSREDFVKIVTADQPEVPDYFAYAAKLNTQLRPTLDSKIDDVLRPMSLDEVLAAVAAGGQLLDTRDPAAFAAAHIQGSINVGLGGRFATFAGSVLEGSHPIIVVAEPGGEKEAVTRLARIGFDQVAGYLDGGMTSTAERDDQVETVDRITARELHEELEGSEPPVVLDVRSELEWRLGHVASSHNVPLTRLPDRLSEVPRGRVVVTCQTGYRSSIAASVLKKHGFEDVIDLVGGMTAWQGAQLPTAA